MAEDDCPPLKERLRGTRGRTAAAASTQQNSASSSGTTTSTSTSRSNAARTLPGNGGSNSSRRGNASATASKAPSDSSSSKDATSTRPRKRAKLNIKPSENIFMGLRNAQYGKRPIKSATELPMEVLMSTESRLGLQLQAPSNIPIIAAELADASKHLLVPSPELSHYYNCLKLLKKVTQKLMADSSIEYPAGSGQFRESKTINAEMFFLFGGVEVTVDLLLQPHFYKTKEKKPDPSKQSQAEGASSCKEATTSSTSTSTSNSTTTTTTTSNGSSSSTISTTSVTTSSSQNPGTSLHIRLIRETYGPPGSSNSASSRSAGVQDPQKVLRHKIAYNAMDLLHYMCQNMGTDIATPLSDHDDLIIYLFTLLTEKQCFLKAATLIEDILGVRAQMFKLDDIPDLERLVGKFEEDQLANFCRVLSITISDLDPKDEPCTLAAQDKACRNRDGTPVSEVNQKTVVELPGFVEKLVRIACKSVAEPDGVTDVDALFSQIDSWVTWLDSSLAFDALAEVANEDEGVYLNLPLHDLSLPLPDSLKTMHEVVYKVEVLHVLCLLLGGKQRHKVHEVLAQCKLMPGLNALFDKVIWRCILRAPIHGANENCDCSPEVALKVQFLRLLHTYCDHHDNKYLIMTRHEVNDLNRISSSASIPQLEAVKKVDRSLLCQGQKGILTKLVDVMKTEPRDSPFRFWMARAIESFLRGKTSYADQTFLLRKGLLEHVVQFIVSSDHHSKEVLQSYFDLMAELMKFNILAFKRFNKAISSEEQFMKFMDLVHKNIVDSNMFVRCLALTIEHFEKEQPENYEWGIQSCRLLQFISKRENRLHFLYKLINIIHVEILTQENVSCLNTTIIFLMFADRIGELARYLCDLRTEEQRQCRPGFLLQNFRELLFFWQEHYLHKDKDCSALEKSSCISFSKWKEMVSLLVCTNTDSMLTVAHYLHMDDLLPYSDPQQAPDPLRTS